MSYDDNALVKVSDFGLAKFMITKECLFTACGTPNYVAPEVIVGHGYETKVDCWSLGVILYVMLCGFPPFYHEDNDELFKQIKEGILDFPSPYWDTISDSAKDLIKSLINIDPTKRLSSSEILKHPWLSGHNNSDKQLPFQSGEYKKVKESRMKYAIMATMILKLWQKMTFTKENK